MCHNTVNLNQFTRCYTENEVFDLNFVKKTGFFERPTFLFFFSFFFFFFFLSFLPIPSSSLSEEDAELSNEYSSWRQTKISISRIIIMSANKHGSNMKLCLRYFNSNYVFQL